MSIRSENLNYYPAEVHKGKDYHVSYYVTNPDSGVLVRKKIRLNRLSGATRDKYARDLVRLLNEKLAKGWNPFIEKNAPKSIKPIIEVIETYRNFMTRELEKDSIRSYNSFLNFFIFFIEKEIRNKNLYMFQFTKTHASELMMYVFEHKAKSARTYNNYLIFFRALFNWFMQYNYCTLNHFISIKKLKQKDKNRIPVPSELRNTLRTYLEENNKNFLCIMLLCYYCFIRPKEICLLKRSDFNLEKGLVRIDEEIAKNDHFSYRTIPDDLIQCLKPILKDVPDHLYLFSANYHGDYSFQPGIKQIDSRKIGKYWGKLREILHIPKNVTFYSLKDTGIIQMSRDGVSWKDIQDQADHSSGDITRIYAKYKESSGSEQIRERASTFGKTDS
jgi:integrase